MATPDKSVYENGIRFECTGCGDCCKSRGRYGFVYVTSAERRALAAQLGLSLRAFTRKHCATTEGHIHLKNPDQDCQFLDGARCTVYAARPQQCRTWPFWPENMKPKVWETEVKKDCPGVGQGRLYTLAEIETIFAEQH